MKKLFISQPMRDKTDAQIREEREAAYLKVRALVNEPVEVIDSFFEGVPHDAKPLWYLGESLKKLGEADIVYFAKDWEHYRGCRMEHQAAVDYGIEYIVYA